MYAELFVENAPATCQNFLAYVDCGLLDGTSFYRILTRNNQPETTHKIEIVQGGIKYDPDSEYQPGQGLGVINHETTEKTGIIHRHGTLSMGRFAPGETYGGFFFCIGDQPELDCGGSRFPDRLGAAAFGRINSGEDILQKIYARAEDREFISKEIEIIAVSRYEDKSVK